MSEPGPCGCNAHWHTVKINDCDHPDRSAGDSSDRVEIVPDLAGVGGRAGTRGNF